MKRLLAVLCLLASHALAEEVTLVYPAPAAPQFKFPDTITLSNGQVFRVDSSKARFSPNVSANYVLRDEGTVTASGSVEVRLPAFVLSADHAVLNLDTREIKASGNVRITLVSPTQK
jgi:lipopolysaccharide assembly outer membrane protein LptD (OstA)